MPSKPNAHRCADCNAPRDRRALRCNTCAQRHRRATDGTIWTEDDLARLAAYLRQGLPNKEIAGLLGRSYEAIKSRVTTDGLSQSHSRADRPWTSPEVETLRALHAGGVQNDEIGRQMRRSKDSIAQKASQLKLPRYRRPVAERFWEKVDRGAEDACWPWRGARDEKGYGAFMLTGEGWKRRVTASRFAYELAVGPPGDLFVCHRCDSPPCCNPAHLFLGTNADNVRDMVAKGRHRGFERRT